MPASMVSIQLEVERDLAELDRLAAAESDRSRLGIAVGIIGALISIGWLMTAIGLFTLVPVLLAVIVGIWWAIAIGVDRLTELRASLRLVAEAKRSTIG